MDEQEKVTKILTGLGMTKQEFNICYYKTSSKKKGTEEGYEVRFRQKGNKKIISALLELGYIHDRFYRNDNGSPDEFSTDTFGKNREYKFVMVAMKKIEKLSQIL